MVSPLIERVPPQGYGGTERVVAYLVDELVALGHEVTLYASGDSQTAARLVPVCPSALRLAGLSRESTAVIQHLVLVERVARDAADYDVIHFHSGLLHFPVVRYLPTPTLTTMHGRLDLPELVPLAAAFADVPVVSISDAQRDPLPYLNWRGTVHNGMDPERLHFQDRAGDYLIFVGRISPEKRPDRAIEIAKRAGRKLIIAAKVDPVNTDYFHEQIEPLLDDPLVQFVGEVDETEKDRLVGGALAMVFPIDWPEPFGMVMIESMACGTPVIAFKCGSVPEVMIEGVTGFVVERMDQAVEAVREVARLSRRECRAAFERRYTSRVMAKGYLALYEAAIAGRETGERAEAMSVP